jgi:hypothetical protein
MGPSRDSLSNHEIVTIATYLVGGDVRHVDTEDVAIKANELAPGRFTWRKYREHINLEIIRVYLSDAKKPAKGGYLLGSGNDGWLLTEAGLGFAKSQVRDLPGIDLSRRSLSQKEQQQHRLERVRMLSSEAYGKFRAGDIASVTTQEAEAFFRLNEYVVGNARQQKVARMVNTYADDPELGDAIKLLVGKIREV